MNKMLTTMVSNVGTEVQDTSTAFATIIKTYINNRYFQILRSINWSPARVNYTFSTTAGTQDYAMPDDFDKPILVLDSTNGIELPETTVQKMGMDFPSAFTSQGSVDSYAILEDTVLAQPSAASALAIVSSSASDTTQKIMVRGIVSDEEVTEEVTVTGTTQASTTNSFSRVKSISKTAVSVGKITVTSNSAAVTVAVLGAQELTSYVKKMRFHYVPSTSLTMVVIYFMKPMPLYSDYDYPVIDISDLIEKGAIADALRYKRQFAKASDFEGQFTSLLADYIWSKENQPNAVYQFFPSTFDRDNLY